MKNSAYIEFQCIRGIQGIYPQYAATWPVTTVLRFLGPIAQSALDDTSNGLANSFFIKRSEDDLLRPEYSRYNVPIVVAVYGEFEFIGMPDWPDCGNLRIEASSELRILEGLQRVAAFVMAKLPISQFSKETIPVLLCPVRGPQRLAVLIERFSAKTSMQTLRRISPRGTQRGVFREKTKDLFVYSQFLRIAVAFGKCSLAPRSRHLLTHSGLTRACTPMFSAFERIGNTNSTALIAEYWQNLGEIILPWRDYLEGKVSACEVRKTTILTSATVVTALGMLGAQVLLEKPSSWRNNIKLLAGLDWRRNSSIWEGRAIRNGIMLKSGAAAISTSNMLKLTCGLTSQTDDLNLERKSVDESE